MSFPIRLAAAAVLFAGGLGMTTAQAAYDATYRGNVNTNGSLAGKSRKGVPGGARTMRIGHGPTDGASSGIMDTTGSLAGIQTRRSRHRGHLRRL